MWNRIKKAFAGSNASLTPENRGLIKDEKETISVVIICDRCGEEISVRMRKSSDIQRNYESGEYAFFVQKTVVGTECFNRIEMRLEMDPRYRLISKHIEGGTLKSRG